MGLGPTEFSFSSWNPSEVPEGVHPRWAVLGRSNVGKSSFLNALVHPYKDFRTGRTPGVTKGLVAVKVRLAKSEESILELVDMPGFGFALMGDGDGERWAKLGEVLKETSRVRGVQWVWLVDPTRDPGDVERDLMTWLRQEVYYFVFTKADKVTRNARAGIDKKWEHFGLASAEKPIWVSSLKGEGTDTFGKAARNFVRNAE